MIPQGSVLGLLVYINDIPNISNKLKIFLFADDINIYYEASNLKQLVRDVNIEIDKLFCSFANCRTDFIALGYIE